jgi:protein-disulfide isomerase
VIINAVSRCTKTVSLWGFQVFGLTLFGVIFSFVAAGQNAKPPAWIQPLSSGNPNAIAKIEVYYDLQCPSCANFHSILKKVEAEFGENVGVTFRHFPLMIPAHDKAFMAARMVEAAHVQGRGREMLDLVLVNQKRWTANKWAKSILFGYAARLKLNMPQFREDFEDEILLRPIINDLIRAKELKLNSTPTVFLNGKELPFIEALDLATKIKEIVK